MFIESPTAKVSESARIQKVCFSVSRKVRKKCRLSDIKLQTYNQKSLRCVSSHWIIHLKDARYR